MQATHTEMDPEVQDAIALHTLFVTTFQSRHACRWSNVIKAWWVVRPQNLSITLRITTESIND
jgi:hypothetical protein